MRPDTPAKIKTRQRFLKSRGFDPGPVDGEWGVWSKKAESAYQDSIDDVVKVRDLQRFLNEHVADPRLDVDGIYGPATRAAETAYQNRLGSEPAAPTPLPLPAVPKPALGDDRTKIIQVAKSLVGIREATGHNDGVPIDNILAACGLRGTKNPYCACFIVYCGDMALGRGKNFYPRSAWSPDMVVKPTWQQGIGGRKPQPADTFGIYFASKKRVAHCGLILDWTEKTPNCLTIEGNTGERGSVTSSGAREGDGIYLKRRMKSDIHSIRNWID